MLFLARTLLPGRWPCSESFVQGLASGRSSVLLCAGVIVKVAVIFSIFHLMYLAQGQFFSFSPRPRTICYPSSLRVAINGRNDQVGGIGWSQSLRAGSEVACRGCSHHERGQVGP